MGHRKSSSHFLTQTFATRYQRATGSEENIGKMTQKHSETEKMTFSINKPCIYLQSCGLMFQTLLCAEEEF